MFDIQRITLMIYGYRDDGARRQSWHPYDDAQLVAVDPVILNARLDNWNRSIVDRRIKLAKQAIGEAERLISSATAREAAVAKLSAEDKSILQIRPENFTAQRERHSKEIAENEVLIQQLSSLSLAEIMSRGLVEHWWVFESADIQTFESFEASLSDGNADDV
jgi:hypothetical protein